MLKLSADRRSSRRCHARGGTGGVSSAPPGGQAGRPVRQSKTQHSDQHHNSSASTRQRLQPLFYRGVLANSFRFLLPLIPPLDLRRPFPTKGRQVRSWVPIIVHSVAPLPPRSGRFLRSGWNWRWASRKAKWKMTHQTSLGAWRLIRGALNPISRSGLHILSMQILSLIITSLFPLTLG